MIIENKILDFKTKENLYFEDVTDEVRNFVAETGVGKGLINIQSLHTTCAVFVNENEPLLIEDMKKNFRELVKRDIYYGHDDFDIRTINMCGLEECKNGHSHCLAAYLPTSVCLNIINGQVSLGQWQRIFFVELDHSRDRQLQMQIIGE